MLNKLGITIFTLASLYSIATMAEQGEVKNSSIGIDLSVDNEKNHDLIVNVSHFIDEVHQLSMAYSKSKVQGDATLGVDDYQSRGYTFAIENFADTRINTGFEYENWGKPGDLRIHSLRTMVAANFESLRLELHPQMQKIRFENVDTRIAALQKIDLTSMGGAINLIIMLNNAWSFDIEYFKNAYYSSFDNVQNAFENAQCQLRYSTRLSAAANSLAATLDDNRKAVGIGWQQAWGSINANYQRAHGFISACDTDQGGVQAAIDLNQSWVVNLAIGSSVGAISDRINYASLGLNYRF